MTKCRHIKECRRLIRFGEAHLCFTKKKEKGHIQESCWSGAPKPNGIYRYPEDWKRRLRQISGKEKVKCKTCGKEGRNDPNVLNVLLIKQQFRIHFDENGDGYFLCLDCEPKEKLEDREYPDELGEVRW